MNKNLCAALTLLLLAVAAPARAEWTALGDSDSEVFYIDRATIRKNGYMRRVWALTDVMTKNPKSRFWSEAVYFEFNCNDNGYVVLQTTSYSERMGKGEVIYTSSIRGIKKFVVPSSIAEGIFRAVCAE